MNALPLGITCHPDKKRFYLVTENSTYVVGVTKDELVLNLYWGPRLCSINDIPTAELQPERSSQDPALTSAAEEYPVFGGLRYGEDCLQVSFPTGTRELDLRYASFATHYQVPHQYPLQQEDEEKHKKHNTLCITLRDQFYDKVVVHLIYRISAATDIIERSAKISNSMVSPETASPPVIHIGKMLSAAWHLPATLLERTLTTLNGAWSAETQVSSISLPTNPHSGGAGMRHVIGSTRGIPSAQAYPYFALSSESNIPGRHDTYFGAVAWSGNWIISIDVDYQGQTRISGGLQPHDFGVSLQSGETFSTPVFMAGYSPYGLSHARQQLPRHIRQTQRPPHHRMNPILYNSWEAAGFNVNLEQQLELATNASRLGIELFVLDDGWFSGRTSDKAGLGDWFHDVNKFPQGLKPLADHVHSLGMKFGLWFEPEMVNPDSHLYRQHPDWVYHYKERARSEERNQLVLDLTQIDVQSYIYERLQSNIKEIGVDYIKWDMNRPISEAGTKQLASRTPTINRRDAREVWLNHVNVFYSIIQRLKTDFPSLLIETCCSGGGRADPGIIKLVDQCWVSDNTQPDARLIIQHGISAVLPAHTISCWVTDMPQSDPGSQSIPLAYRFHVAFMGTLGIGSDILKYSEDQMKEAIGWINLYKMLRPILQQGDLDWLHTDHNRLVVTMTSTHDRNEAVLLCFRPSSPFWLPLPPIRLRHLDPKATYRLKMWTTSGYYHDHEDEFHTGARLMYKGLFLSHLTSGAYKSAVVWIRKEK